MVPFLWSLRARNPRARLVHVEHSYTAGLEAALVPHKRRFRTMLGLAMRPFNEIICVSGGQARWLSSAVPSTAARVRAINPWGNVTGLDFTLSRVEAARNGIKVSALCPGVVQTPLLEGGGKFGGGKLGGG